MSAADEASSALDTSQRVITTHAPDAISEASTSPALPDRPSSVMCVPPLRTSQEATSWPSPPRPPVTTVALSAAEAPGAGAEAPGAGGGRNARAWRKCDEASSPRMTDRRAPARETAL